MTMANVLLIKGQSRYDILRNFIDDVEEGFRACGYNTCVLDYQEQACRGQLKRIAKKTKIDIIFVFNAVLADRDLMDNFPEAYFVTYMVDHPLYHGGRLSAINDKGIVFVCDRRHKAYIKKHYPNIKRVEFLPLASSSVEEYIPFEERKLDVVFSGTYVKPVLKYAPITKLEGTLKVFAEHMVKCIVESPELDLEQCLEKSLVHFGVEVSEKEFNELLGDFMGIDGFVRCYYRDKVIRYLVESGIKVHVLGDGWETFECEKGKENLVILKGGSRITRKMVSNAKIFLNVMPWFKSGFHDRIAQALICGAVSVTDESEYILENFKDKEDLVIYSLERLEELPEKVKWLLENPKEASDIAEKGRRRAKEMTWQSRAMEMAEYIHGFTGAHPLHTETCGESMPIPYDTLHWKSVMTDTISKMNELLEGIEEMQACARLGANDVMEFYQRYLFYFFRAKENYPELSTSPYVYNYLIDANEESIELATELLIRECSYILAWFARKEREQLIGENNYLRNALQEKK